MLHRLLSSDLLKMKRSSGFKVHSIFFVMLLLICSLLSMSCGPGTGTSEQSPTPTLSPTLRPPPTPTLRPPPTPTPTPTPTLALTPTLTPTPTPSPTPVPTVPANSLVIDNTDLKLQHAYPCEVVADVTNPLDMPAYHISVQALVKSAISGLQETDQLNGPDTIYPKQKVHYARNLTLTDLGKTEPAYITTTVFQNGQRIGQTHTLIPATCH